MDNKTQLAIIGAGPGGYVAAFHAADLGLQVTLIDKDQNPGGVCLYRGCIPSKALLHAAKTITEASEAKNFGVEFNTPSINIDTLRSWKDMIVARLTGGLGQLTKQRKITYIQGTAKFLNATTLEIKKLDGTIEQLTFEKAAIATGAEPAALPFLPKSPHIWDSADALALPCIPTSLLVIGGGYIGLELGTAYAALGANVSVVEALPQLLTGIDQDLADILIRRLKKTFSKIMTGTKVLTATETPDGILVTFQDSKGQESQETYSHVLVSVGRKPNATRLGLENTVVKLTDKGFIPVNAKGQTTEKNIYAIGDVTGQPMLAHKASAEAKNAIHAIIGKEPSVSQEIPAVVFTDPELAWVGLTENEAKSQGLTVAVSKFPWAASGRAMTLDRTDGITKIIADSASQKILGIGIVGVHAGELIAEGTLAIQHGLTAQDLAMTVHPHPALSETLMETAEGIFGQATHIFRVKK